MEMIENSGLHKEFAEGKMMGVLIVTDKEGQTGFLSGFSGNVGEKSIIEGFVPPIYDLLDPHGHFKIREAEITAIEQVYCAETADSFHIETYDYILDAIDSLDNKVLLIRRACETQATFFASMGAALKMDPLKINIAEFWKVQGCPLAKALRQKFKKSKQFPAKKFKCVYSEELLENKGAATFCETTETLAEHDWHAAKVHTNGTIAHTTAIFGFMLAGLVIQDIIKQ
jgi:tRNA A37 threonylcarbamoyladenosine dehydratase